MSDLKKWTAMQSKRPELDLGGQARKIENQRVQIKRLTEKNLGLHLALAHSKTRIEELEAEVARLQELAAMRARLEELTSLRVGWDGGRSDPVSVECAQIASDLIERLSTLGIPTPQLVPLSGGDLQLEWNQNEVNGEVRIMKKRKDAP